MPCCCIKNCNNRSETSAKSKNGISFHLFPRNTVKRQKWINAIGRENWLPTDATVVCSKHFRDNCFYRTKSGLIRLLDDAIPSFYPIIDEDMLQIQEKYTCDRKMTLVNKTKDTKLTIAHFPVLKIPVLDGNSTEKDKILATHIKRMLFMCKRQRKAIREVQKFIQKQENALKSIDFQPFMDNSNNEENSKKQYSNIAYLGA